MLFALFEQSAVVYGWPGLPTKDTSLAFKKLNDCSNFVWRNGIPSPREGRSANPFFPDEVAAKKLVGLP